MTKTRKKSTLLLLILTLVLSLSILLSGCANNISFDEAWEKFEVSIKNSMEYDIYYYKIKNFRDKNVPNLKVNVHCDADNHGLLYNPDGSYKNYAVRIEEYYDSKMVDEKFCGTSFNSKGESKNVFIDKEFDNGKITKSYIKEMRTEDYVLSKEFEPYSLQYQLFELSKLQKDDIDINGEKFEFSKWGVVTKLKFSLKDEYYENYEKTYNRESILKGDYIEIELSYDRVAKIIVYDKVVLDANMNITSYDEKYRFDIVYLGKNIDIPKYDEEWMKYEWIE